jgi:hypothetical protein
VIVLIISISFSGSYLYAAQNNTEETNKTIDNINNTDSIDITPRTTVDLPVYKDLDGLGSLSIKQEFMKRPILGECYVWKPFKKGYDNRGKDKWYNAWHFWWHLAYPIALITEGIVFIVLMLGWFFASVAWCLYAICIIIAHLPELIMTIGQIGLSFNPQSMRNVKTFNNTLPKICNYTQDISTIDLIDNPFYSGLLKGTLDNKTISGIIVNGTLNRRSLDNITIFNCTINNYKLNINDTLSTNNTKIVNATLINGTILTGTVLYNETKMTDFVYTNSLSNSSGIYENATTNQLKDTLKGLQKTRKAWTRSLTIVDNLFDSLSAVFNIISMLSDIFAAVSASLAAPSSGSSLASSVAEESAKEGVKQGVGAVVKQTLSDFAKNRAKDIGVTAIHNIVDKAYLDHVIPKANGKENDTGNYATTFERRAMKITDQVVTAIDKGFNNKPFKKTDVFGWIRSGVSIITGVGKLIVDLNFDNEEDLVQHELDFRSENNITI